MACCVDCLQERHLDPRTPANRLTGQQTHEGGRGEERGVDCVRRLATAARNEVEGLDESLGFFGGVDAKGMVEGDHVGVEEILAAQAGMDAAEEEGEAEEVLEVQVLVDCKGGAAASAVWLGFKWARKLGSVSNLCCLTPNITVYSLCIVENKLYTLQNCTFLSEVCLCDPF